MKDRRTLSRLKSDEIRPVESAKKIPYRDLLELLKKPHSIDAERPVPATPWQSLHGDK